MTRSADSSGASTPRSSSRADAIEDLRELDRIVLESTRAYLRRSAERGEAAHARPPFTLPTGVLTSSLDSLETREKFIAFDLRKVRKQLDRIGEEVASTGGRAERTAYDLAYATANYQDATCTLARLEAALAAEVEVHLGGRAGNPDEELPARAVALRQRISAHRSTVDEINARFADFGITPARP